MISELEKRELLEDKKTVQNEFLQELLKRLEKEETTSIYRNLHIEIQRIGEDIICSKN